METGQVSPLDASVYVGTSLLAFTLGNNLQLESILYKTEKSERSQETKRVALVGIRPVCIRMSDIDNIVQHVLECI